MLSSRSSFLPLVVLAVFQLSCGGSTAPQISRALLVPSEAIRVPEPVHEAFLAYAPAGFDASIAYIDFGAIRETAELDAASEVLGDYLSTERPDVSGLFTSPGLNLQQEASRAVLASPVGRWSWIMTIEYEPTRPVVQVLSRATQGVPTSFGEFEVRSVIGVDQNPPLAGCISEHEIVLATTDGIGAGSSAERHPMSFAHTGDLVAWQLQPATSLFRRLGLIGTAVPLLTRTRLIHSPEPDRASLLVSSVADFATEAIAASSRTQLLHQVDGLRGNPLVTLAGFASVLDSVEMRPRGSALEIEFRISGIQMATLLRLFFFNSGNGFPDPPSTTSNPALNPTPMRGADRGQSA